MTWKRQASASLTAANGAYRGAVRVSVQGVQGLVQATLHASNPITTRAAAKCAGCAGPYVRAHTFHATLRAPCMQSWHRART